MYGKVTGDWTPLQQVVDQHGGVHHPDPRPTSRRTASTTRPIPPTTRPRHDLPSGYPSRLDSSVVGRQRPDRRRAAERRTARRTSTACTGCSTSTTSTASAARRRRHRRSRRTSTPSSAGRRSRCGRPCRSRPARLQVRPGTNAATWTCSSRARRPRSSGSTPTRRTPTRGRPGRVLGADVGPTRRARQRDRRHAGRQGREDGRLPALRDVRQVLQDDRLHQPAPARPAPATTRRTT